MDTNLLKKHIIPTFSNTPKIAKKISMHDPPFFRTSTLIGSKVQGIRNCGEEMSGNWNIVPPKNPPQDLLCERAIHKQMVGSFRISRTYLALDKSNTNSPPRKGQGG
uniref:Uncharacterized protein n=1 Tax=Lactuca sativa TaxID=4236 RepID=A0A9R1VV95_LACSA|nr:hypothetical protein LSAT_V11C400168520 [Lactuca sativa]